MLVYLRIVGCWIEACVVMIGLLVLKIVMMRMMEEL